MINIAFTGKGGVGKTTIAGVISRLLARDGYNVLAVDADPDMNLGSALGIDTSNIIPLTENRELIAERTGTAPGKSIGGGVFKLNPKVDDIAEKYGVRGPDGVDLIVMGTVEKGGTGCMCPSDSFLRALLRHLIIQKEDAVVLDMEAGIEHLGRGTAKSVDFLITVVEPGMKSLKTAERIKDLARDIDLKEIKAILNKVRGPNDSDLICRKLEERGIPLIGNVPYEEDFVKSDLVGESPLDYAKDSEGIMALEEIKNKIIRESEGK